MDHAQYFIRGRHLDASDPGFQDALSQVYESPERPRCLCVRGGVEMYVAKHAEYVIKRMPGTGHLHSPTCPSFEPEPGVSGLDELMGEAIVQHSPDQVEIHTDFPLARLASRGLQRGEPGREPGSVKQPRRRLSLRSLTHYLFDRAGFNRWYPAMQGKRNNGLVRHYLLEEAKAIVTRGDTLDKRLYIPETFRVADKEQIAERRRRKLAMLMSPEADVQFKMALVIGELVDVETTTSGRRLVLKHMPDAPLSIDDKAWERAARAYAGVLQAAHADVPNKPRVIVTALIYAKREYLYQVDALSLMLVTDQWVPIEGLHELQLVEELQRQQRSFYKPLRYDTRNAAGFANALLLDGEGGVMPMHVFSPFIDDKDRAIKGKAVDAAQGRAWVWDTDKDMPELPRQRVRGRGTQVINPGDLGSPAPSGSNDLREVDAARDGVRT